MFEAYNNYDHLFFNVKPHAVGNIRIFGTKDDYLIEQNYHSIAAEEHKIWHHLSHKLAPLLDQYASEEYLRGLPALHLNDAVIPDFTELSTQLKKLSGWQVTPVAGFLDEYVFFSLTAQFKFPVTDIIRTSRRFDEKYAGVRIQNEDVYTPEPDIFHDVRGHLPFLTDEAYGHYVWEMARLGLELIEDERGLGPQLIAHNLKRLQNLAWWTYEFGVMKKSSRTDSLRKKPNDMDYDIYGAGILSSYNEVTNVILCAQGKAHSSRFLPFDIEEACLTRFDYSDIQDRYYVIDSMESLYKEFHDHTDLFWFEG
ncbi:MAG: hypothetical protein ACE5EE_01175 [Fidelibacterota bacterium]